MAETELTPYLNELLKQSGVLFKVFEHNTGYRMKMPESVQTFTDRNSPEVYHQLKMTILCTVAGAFIDQNFPYIVQNKGAEFRGQMVARLAAELYRLLTDGVSIDVLRLVVSEPDPAGPKDKQQ